MKPLNIDKTGCTNMSSNCVVWEGPDIECINLCKGDSVTEVVYKLALELCKLMETFDLKNYDLQCFSTGVCQPQTFHDFINILINKVCALQACNPQCGDSCNPCPTPVNAALAAQSEGGGGDIYVPIAKEFQFKGPTGDQVTMLRVSDYSQAIGNKVSEVVNSIKGVQAAIADHSERLEALEKQGPPQFEMPTVTPLGVLPKEPTSMQLVLAATEQQFIELRTALGDHKDIYTNIQKMDAGINSLKSLSIPGSNISSLRGFTAQPANMADVFGNILVMIGDMRTALKNVIDNYIPSACDAISLELLASKRNNQLVLFFTGTVPSATFINTGGKPTTITIADNHGSLVEYPIDIFTVLNAPSGHIIDISETRLVGSDDLTITASPSFTNKTDGSVCKSQLRYVVINQVICPAVVYTASADSIGFSFNSSSGTQAYTVELLDSTGTDLISSQTFISTGVRAFTGTFSSLQTGTLYKARVKISLNDTESVCEFTSITTL